MSRPPTTDSPTNDSAAGVESLLEQLQADNSEEPSSASPPRTMSKDSDGYPSWLPQRPLHPAPASTFQSSVHEAGPSDHGGRKPTPRSVRIVSLQDASNEKDRREPTDQTRVGIPPPRVWSKGMGTPLPPASADYPERHPPRPRFHANGLHLEHLQNPALKLRLYFYLFPILVFAHIPLQTFFDFNAVFMLVQISKFPNPNAPGVPGSGRNWALAAAAYVACWLVWILPLFIVYELVYSFGRRWRVKRPIMLPLYLSSAGFNLVSMTSYTNFCFMLHLRFSAFFGENGSLRDGMAETFWFYSQNMPTVALLLPRAGLSLAVLLAFSSPVPSLVAQADAGIGSHRDSTYFRSDGTLSGYSRGILIANAAWTAWRALIVIWSWIGLWVVSGSGCAGLCGPRHRWEEDDAEKTMSFYSDNISDLEALPWSWREHTALRVQEAFEFCLTVRPSSRYSQRKKNVTDTSEVPAEPPFEGMEQVLAAVGLSSAPTPARRGVLSGELFETPTSEHAPGFGDIIPKVAKRSSKERDVGPSAPLMKLPYPFTAPGAQMSSQDRVPFPPSPGPVAEDTSGSLEEEEDEDEDEEDEDEEDEDEEDDEDDDEEDEDEDEDDEDELVEAPGSEEPSSGRASGSMSSLGHPVVSRYPFQFRRPARGASSSSGAASHMTPNTRSTQSQATHSTQSRVSQATQSTGNRESSDSQSPRSQNTSSSGGPVGSQRHNSAGAGVIPMPPRHPQQGRSRNRAGTVPVPASSSSSSASSPSVDFPRAGRSRVRSRMDSGVTDAFGVVVAHAGQQQDNDAESEGSHEAEREDQLGLLSLSAGPSPRSSFTALRHRASNVSSQGRRPYGSQSSHSGSSSSRSRAGSVSVSVRSRAQSLLQNIGAAASHSSVELVQRLRANSSMARLEEDTSDRANTHSRSGSASDAMPSSGENHTFGHPLRMEWRDETHSESEVAAPAPALIAPASREVSPQRLQPSQSRLSVFSAPSTQQPSERTVSRPPSTERQMAEAAGIPIIRHDNASETTSESYPDISSAPQSFVTAPATIEGGTTESSGRTISSWGGTSHMRDPSQGTWHQHHGPA
ncbi:hypothetical protein FB45DRAFT_361259 [Roridomyces roridus]|uniref:Uncharacterized protein n=1 Tax=Roridomyces roridus TaxID=1738132 RepID=A0AAD7C858_9AGAR|nr:hypothetical protein FB45DRAFT_361259 [Roridomyces roridus]